MSVPPEPTGRGTAKERWGNSREKKSRASEGGRGRGNKGNTNWEDWNQSMNYQYPSPRLDASDQIIPQGKGRHMDIRLSQGGTG
eukprot:1042786-Karenia_brevis.AAC.1